jgi:hypothetical protein
MNASKISQRLRNAGLPVVAADARSELAGLRVTNNSSGNVAVRSHFGRDTTEAVLAAQDATHELEEAGFAVQQTAGLTTIHVADPLTDELSLSRRAREIAVAMLNAQHVELFGTVERQLIEAGLVFDGKLSASFARTLGLRVAPAADNTFSRVPVVHRFRTSRDAYDASQTSELIANGDVLVALDERVIGVLMSAWPIAITAEYGDMHTLTTPAGEHVVKLVNEQGAAGIAFAAGVVEAISVARYAGRLRSSAFQRADAFTAFELNISCSKCTELVEDAELFESYDKPAGMCADCAAFEREITAHLKS